MTGHWELIPKITCLNYFVIYSKYTSLHQLNWRHSSMTLIPFAWMPVILVGCFLAGLRAVTAANGNYLFGSSAYSFVTLTALFYCSEQHCTKLQGTALNCILLSCTLLHFTAFHSTAPLYVEEVRILEVERAASAVRHVKQWCSVIRKINQIWDHHLILPLALYFQEDLIYWLLCRYLVPLQGSDCSEFIM